MLLLTSVYPDTGGGWLNGRGDDSMKMLVGYGHIVDFFTSVRWWELDPDNGRIGTLQHNAYGFRSVKGMVSNSIHAPLRVKFSRPTHPRRSRHSSGPEKGDSSLVMSLFHSFRLRQFLQSDSGPIAA